MYRLGVINSGTLRTDIQTRLALKLGKEDPNSKIGENKYSGDKDHFWALKDVSFDVKKGDRVGIIGKNGAGKSTILKIMSRITAPTEGTIKIKGKIASLLEVGTGFNGELTGRENIFLNGAILGMKKRQVAKKMDSIIDFSGIEHYIDTPVKRYSSGMYVRLAFAVAAHLDSDILIADEVLAVGDAEFQKKALGKMESLSTGEGRTVFFVSHNLITVGQLCSYAYLFKNGCVAYHGKTIDVIDYYTGANVAVRQGEWKNNSGSQLKEEYFSPTLFAILDKYHNVIKKPLPAGEALFIKIEGICKEENPSLQIGFALLDSDDNVILWSFHTDHVDNNLWPKISLGNNAYLVQLPYAVLNAGKYKIRFLSAIYSVKWLYSPTESDILVEFELTAPEKQSYYITGSRPGVLSFFLEWEKGE